MALEKAIEDFGVEKMGTV